MEEDVVYGHDSWDGYIINCTKRSSGQLELIGAEEETHWIFQRISNLLGP
jgi:hypothetical protein